MGACSDFGYHTAEALVKVDLGCQNRAAHIESLEYSDAGLVTAGLDAEYERTPHAASSKDVLTASISAAYSSVSMSVAHMTSASSSR